jgi:hypothetical protein
LKQPRKSKIDKILDWLCEHSTEWNYHQDFWKFVSPPANRTYAEITDWLTSRMEAICLKIDLAEQPFKIYSTDIIRWRENNQELLIGTSAIALHKKQGKWIGIDPYRTLAFTLGQMAFLQNLYFEKAKKEPDFKTIILLEKLAARTAITTEALAKLELNRDKTEVGLGFAYQLATDIKSMANQDPSATPQMREWLVELLSAGLAKLEEQTK